MQKHDNLRDISNTVATMRLIRDCSPQAFVPPTHKYAYAAVILYSRQTLFPIDSKLVITSHLAQSSAPDRPIHALAGSPVRAQHPQPIQCFHEHEVATAHWDWPRPPAVAEVELQVERVSIHQELPTVCIVRQNPEGS